LSLQRLVNQLLTLQTSIAAFDKAIQALFAQHPDHLIFESLPGLAPNWLPDCWRPLAPIVLPLSHPSEMQKKSGTARVGSQRSRQDYLSALVSQQVPLPTFHEFAAHSIPHSTWAKACYQELLARGKSHNAAVRWLWARFNWSRSCRLARDGR